MKKLLFKNHISLFDIICVYGITWLGTQSLWWLLLIIPLASLSKRMSRRYVTYVPTSTFSVNITRLIPSRRDARMAKVPVPNQKKWKDSEVAWNHTMSNADRRLLLQSFAYIQHRLLEHPDAGIQGVVSLERVQKWIKELS